MAIEFIWRLPVSGDSRFGNAARTRRGERSAGARSPFTAGVSDPRGDRFNYFDYLHQVARAAELAGFDGIQIPDDPVGDESWIVAGYVARSTRRLKLLTEFAASRGSAVYAAKNAVSYQRFTGGRFAWQLHAGGGERERRRYGDFVADADVYPRIEEFITVARGVLTQHPYSFKGRFFEVLDGGFQGPLANRPVPQVYLSGNHPEAYEAAAKHADVHVFDARPLEELAAEIGALREAARAAGRELSFGLRIDVLARETEKEAFFDAQREWEQSRLPARFRDPLVAPNFWEGFATERTGAAAALVGDYAQVARRLAEYAEAGIGSFVLAASPHFEEAYRAGEYLLPQVRALTASSNRLAA
ncbi:LLM class flavin-dependent oxidoreductase [Thauera sinica]|uniref:LLM class flavin-dependent oxidoreductase n=1 Tax=Thauera sinica TaxID=2665146 RepID=A0ABW1AM30_9RHOO|nr:LLM class flavin-dependent oxidoreductase [Thauera sp. K11]ATE59178.1 alkanesulfonate monooxygenase [Thauera sp. K11]